jgi:cbb3-type cytochrome oxidase subunit 3
MYKNILQSIENIEIWPIVSLVVFFLFFVGLTVWVMTVDKKYINEMKNLPFNEGTEGDSISMSNPKK